MVVTILVVSIMMTMMVVVVVIAVVLVVVISDIYEYKLNNGAVAVLIKAAKVVRTMMLTKATTITTTNT